MSKAITTPARSRRPDRLPLDKIKIRRGHNTRPVDAGLKKSVGRYGVLQPVNIEEEGGEYWLVAGHRRCRAAKLTKQPDVPVTFTEPDVDDVAENGARPKVQRALVAAMENISRKDLNVLEEALELKRLLDVGFTEKGVQEALNVSARWITQRKKILAVPDFWHPAISAGCINDHELTLLVSICDTSEALARALLNHNADAIEQGECQIDGWSVAQAARDTDGLWPLSTAVDPETLGFDEQTTKKLDALIEHYRARTYRTVWTPTFTELEIDRARAAGVLWEPDDRGSHLVVIDTELYRDLVLSALDRELRECEEKKTKKATKKKPAAGTPEAKAQAERQDARRDALSALRDAQADARDMNLRLGRNLLKGLSSVKLTPDVAAYLVATIVRKSGHGGDPLGSCFSFAQLAHGGMRYVMEEYQVRSEPKPGKVKIEFADVSKAEQILKKWLGGAKTAEQRLGRMFIAVVAHQYAIDHVVARTKRFPHGSKFADGNESLARIAKRHLPRGLEGCRTRVAEAERAYNETRGR